MRGGWWSEPIELISLEFSAPFHVSHSPSHDDEVNEVSPEHTQLIGDRRVPELIELYGDLAERASDLGNSDIIDVFVGFLRCCVDISPFLRVHGILVLPKVDGCAADLRPFARLLHCRGL